MTSHPTSPVPLMALTDPSPNEPNARCPRCNASLSTLTRPCSMCGLGFVQRELSCVKCNEPIGSHIMRCPAPATITCPLCGGKRHWKDGGRASVHECLWRQWARDTDLLDEPMNPRDLGPAEDAQTLARFQVWLDAHPNREAGSVHAERYIRQASRLSTPTLRKQTVRRPIVSG